MKACFWISIFCFFGSFVMFSENEKSGGYCYIVLGLIFLTISAMLFIKYKKHPELLEKKKEIKAQKRINKIKTNEGKIEKEEYLEYTYKIVNADQKILKKIYNSEYSIEDVYLETYKDNTAIKVILLKNDDIIGDIPEEDVQNILDLRIRTSYKCQYINVQKMENKNVQKLQLCKLSRFVF